MSVRVCVRESECACLRERGFVCVRVYLCACVCVRESE